MLSSAASSTSLRACVEQFIENQRLGICWLQPNEPFEGASQRILERLAELRGEEDLLFMFGPGFISRTRADIMKDKRQLLQMLLSIDSDLIYVETIENWAVESGAIPDPNTHWKLYRLPEGGHACWECGRNIHEDKPDPESPCSNCDDISKRRREPRFVHQEQQHVLRGSTR